VKTFAHWRAVGRAMLDARRREGVTVTLKRYQHGYGSYRMFTWNGPDRQRVTVGSVLNDLHVTAIFGDRHCDLDADAATVLRVLAALELIHADIAYAADERYGRCEKCGRLAQWWPAEACSPARWVHVYGNDERFVDYANHQPVVAESNPEHKDAP
jgi:hypothetical protein